MTLRIALVARASNPSVKRLPKGLRVGKLTDRQLERIAAEMEFEAGMRRHTDNHAAKGGKRHLKLL